MNTSLKIADIDLLVSEFVNGTLSETEWTHRAHLIVCAYFLSNYEQYDATLRIKLGIINYNKATGLENTIERGYHETMTLFWVWAVNAYLVDKLEWNLEAKINGLMESPFSKKYLPFFFYTEDLMFSRMARVRWVEPDQRGLNRKSILTEYPTSIWFGDDH